MTERIVGDELPRLIIPAPICSHCDEEVAIDADGSARCVSCLVQWSIRALNDPAVYVTGRDPAAVEPCGARGDTTQRMGQATAATRLEIVGRQIRRPKRLRPCILPRGHTSPHLHPRVFDVP